MKVKDKDYDFKGYATKVNIRCSDGRTILRDAFKDNDGAIVPLVWQHMHNEPSNILGHAKLENRSDGVYAYCKFNSTPSGENAKALVKHGDITALSIYANSLIQKGKEVVHGMIREVSLVLTGANPGALIDNIAIEHADGSIVQDDEEAIIYSGLNFDFNDDTDEDPGKTAIAKINLKKEDIRQLSKMIKHSDEEEQQEEALFNQFKKFLEFSHAAGDSSGGRTVKEVFDDMNDDQKNFVYAYMLNTIYGDEIINDIAKEANVSDDDDGESFDDVFQSMTDEQKNCVYMIANSFEEIMEVDEDEDEEDEAVAQSMIKYNSGGSNMKRNVFDNSVEDDDVIQHSAEDLKAIFEDAKRLGSMREACLAHSITNIDILFPDATTIGQMPEMIKRDDAWVPTIINLTKHIPFARVKSYAADITAEEARARGYIKGNQKVEEVLSVLKRSTNPTTIYKKQKLDRDDLLDITDFDVVAFLKNEMRAMLNEEIARAVLTGDGRGIGTDDKISEDCIRPVYGDVAPFVTRYILDSGLPIVDLIDNIVRARKDYRGSGTPILFATTDIITDMLLVKDTTGRRIYNTEAELSSGLRVSQIIEVPIMEGISRVVSQDTLDLKAIMFNPRDYTIGSNAGGQISFFDDFDIDYNAQKYLIETRISGCLTRPKAAIVFEQKQ